MTVDNLTIGEAKKLAAIFGGLKNEQASEKGDGRAVIVRSRDAGVLFGEFAGNEGSTISLRNAVQLWQWKAAKGGSLIDVATFGVTESGCKFSNATATVTVFNACALIDVTDEASASIKAVKVSAWK